VARDGEESEGGAIRADTQEYDFGEGTVLGIVVYRRMVRQALANAAPPERQPRERKRSIMAPLMPFIDAVLEADSNAPREQRHAAHRIWPADCDGAAERKVSEVTIRQFVRERKRGLGWSAHATCVPQSYAPGQEGQVDRYET
jgi:hypothetical protein